MSQTSDAESPLARIHAARMLAVLEAARSAASLAANEQRSAVAAIARHTHELQEAQASAEKLAARARDIQNSLSLLRESVDRARLTALNAGLEGARLGDAVGKALLVMGDEVRHLLARALDSLQEHAALLSEVDRDRDRYFAEFEAAGAGAREAGQALVRAESQSQLTSALLGELGRDLGELLGTDPEATRLLAESADQVRRMAVSLSELTRRSPNAAGAVRDLLRPLLAIAATDEEVPP